MIPDTVELDALRTLAVETLTVLATTKDDEVREEYIIAVLLNVYRRGAIAANFETMERNHNLLFAKVAS